MTPCVWSLLFPPIKLFSFQSSNACSRKWSRNHQGNSNSMCVCGQHVFFDIHRPGGVRQLTWILAIGVFKWSIIYIKQVTLIEAIRLTLDCNCIPRNLLKKIRHLDLCLQGLLSPLQSASTTTIRWSCYFSNDHSWLDQWKRSISD
jgi:hypothetical protein